MQETQSASLADDGALGSNPAGHFMAHAPHPAHDGAFTNRKRPILRTMPKNAPSGHRYRHHQDLVNRDRTTTAAKATYANMSSSSSWPKWPKAMKGS